MGVFRNYTPKRRVVSSEVNHYREHKNSLKADYKNRCGYCGDVDQWRFIWFEIDHFVPQKFLVNLKDTDYSNLVYSCRSCNNSKRAKWPTENENIHHSNDKGFIDPCDEDYNKQFERDDIGRIFPRSKLGQWKYNALKLYKPQHEIIWNIEQLQLLITEIKEELKLSPSNMDLKDRLIVTYEKFEDYLTKLFSF